MASQIPRPASNRHTPPQSHQSHPQSSPPAQDTASTPPPSSPHSSASHLPPSQIYSFPDFPRLQSPISVARSSANLTHASTEAQPALTARTEGDLPDSSNRPTQAREQQQQQETTQNASNSPTETTLDDPRRCWICYSDETEDPTPKPIWCSPCPCALTAHETCLLDWLADMENPNNPHTTSGRAKLQCPQCKSEIIVTRPRSLLVSLSRHLENLAGKLIAPGLVFSLASTVYAGCCLHGIYTMGAMFGREATYALLMSGDTLLKKTRVNLALPMIPLALVAARTRFADAVLLPVTPVAYFALQAPGTGMGMGMGVGGGGRRGTNVILGGYEDAALWPPSPSLVFATLPYLRSFYAVLYEKWFGELERKWVAAVQPRAGEAEEEEVEERVELVGGNQEGQQRLPGGGPQAREQVLPDEALFEDADDDADDDDDEEFGELMGFNFQIQLNLGEVVEEEEEDVPDAAELERIEMARRRHARRQHFRNRLQQQQGQQQQGQQDQNQNQNQNQQRQRRQQANRAVRRRNIHHREDIVGTNLADTVLGALVLPFVSASMGSLLKAVLPSSWTSSSAGPTLLGGKVVPGSKTGGLLATRWGRSVVGGCLFVLLKDALRLYCRWRVARAHRERRVLDYDKRMKRVVR